MAEDKRQRSRTLKPIMEFSHDGDQYKVTGSAEGIAERTKQFVLDVEQEDVTIDGRKVKVHTHTYTNISADQPMRKFIFMNEC